MQPGRLDARIELIEPLDDRSPYARSLADRGGADHVHHLRLDVEDFAGALARLRGLELGEILDGRFRGTPAAAASTAVYLDTEADLGFVVEVADVPPGSGDARPDYTYPSSVQCALEREPGSRPAPARRSPC